MSRYVYIHNQYKNFEIKDKLVSLYSEQRTQRQYELGIQKIKNKLHVLNTQTNKGFVNDEEFFAILQDAQKGLEIPAQQMMNQIQMPNIGHDTLSKNRTLDDNIQAAQKVVNLFKDIAKFVLQNNDIIDKHPEAFLMDEKFFQQKFKKGVEIKKAYRDAFLKTNNQSLININQSNYQGARSTYSANMQKIVMNIKALDELEKMYQNNTHTKFMSETLYSDTYYSLLHSLLGIFNSILGFISEEGLIDAINNSKIMEDLLEVKFDSFVANSSADKASGGLFAKNTQDIALSLNLNKMLKGGDVGHISIKIPGISLKRSNLVAGRKQTSITIKSKTTFGKFLLAAGTQIETSQLKAFFNSYANYNRQIQLRMGGKKYKSQLSKDEQASMEKMYDYINATFLPHALGGALNKEDFAYYFIINNRVYNIIEIIRMVLKREDGTALISDLSQKQYSAKVAHSQNFQELPSQALIRSQKTYDVINKLQITMKLHLAANKITK